MTLNKSKFLTLLFMFFALFVMNTSEAQPPSSFECGEIIPANKIVLKANGFDLLYVNFSAGVPDGLFFENGSGQIVSMEEEAISETEIAYKITDTNSKFNLKGTNTCGEQYELLSYPLSNELVEDPNNYVNPADQPVAISRKMSDALVDYTEGQIPLNQFLLDHTDLNIYEKAYVYQRSILKNKEPIDIGFTILVYNPTVIITGGGGGPPNPVPCNCTKFFVPIEITPSRLGWSNTSESKHVYQHLWNYNGEDQTSTSLANGGSTWRLWSVLGLGGYRGLWTDGWKEDKNHYDERVVYAGDQDATLEDLEEPSSFFAEITLSLICNDGQQIPDECGCDRLVHFDYFYRSQLHTTANTYSGGGGDKESVAAAQDLAAAYVAEQGEIGQNETTRLVNTLDFRISSECERNVNPEFWSNIFDLTGDIVEIFLLINGVDSDSPVYDSLYNELSEGDQTNILESLENVMTMSYYSPSNCSSSDESEDINNTYTTLLKPNKRMRLGLFNMHRLTSGGMRSWYSHVSRSADFSISAVIQPGDGGEEPLDEDCCFPWTGVYAYYDFFSDNQGEHVETFFDAYGLPDPIGLDDPDPEAFGGFVTRPAEGIDCESAPTGGAKSEENQLSDQLSKPFLESSIVIYTIDGKFVEKYETTINSDEVEQFVRRQLKNRIETLTNGIYVIAILNENGVQSFKYLNL